jgi:hypothetical protein
VKDKISAKEAKIKAKKCMRSQYHPTPGKDIIRGGGKGEG